jgi:6-hydroxynicotinate 3-monooxygenase
MTRADLQTALIAGLQPETIELGKRLLNIDDNGSRPRMTFADGTTAEADFVVGADGVNSRIRELLLGPTPPVFSGVVAYRSAFSTSRLSGRQFADSTKWWGEDRHFIIYYLSGARDIICVITGAREKNWDVSVPSLPATVDEVRQTYVGFHEEVQSVIDAAPEFSKWPLFVRDPLPLWSRGKIVLLGDACHPMRPHMGQGAAMAMEDAVMLVRCLKAESSLQNAFERYRINRIDRTSAIQQESQKNTWMKYEMDPGWVYGYDVFYLPLQPLSATNSPETSIAP